MADPQLELLNFVLTLASNRDLMREFLNDPKGVAQRAQLSKEQVRALERGDQVALNELVGADLGEWMMAKFQGVPPPPQARRIPPSGGKAQPKKGPKK